MTPQPLKRSTRAETGSERQLEKLDARVRLLKLQSLCVQVRLQSVQGATIGTHQPVDGRFNDRAGMAAIADLRKNLLQKQGGNFSVGLRPEIQLDSPLRALAVLQMEVVHRVFSLARDRRTGRDNESPVGVNGVNAVDNLWAPTAKGG